MAVRRGYKQTEVGVIPADWNLCPLRSIGQWSSGGTPSMSIASYWSGNMPWVSPKDMKVPRLRDSLDHITPKAVADGARLVPAGAVLVVIRGMILAHSFPVAIAEKALSFNQDIKAVVAGDCVDSVFLLYWLAAHAQQLRSLVTESTHGTKRLPTELLFRELVACPSTPEQRAIAEVLSDADALTESLEQLLVKKRQIKQGAMQKLLAGRRRLPGFSGLWEARRLGDIADIDPENLGKNVRPNYVFNYIELEDVLVGTLSGYSEQVFRTAPSRARRKLRKHDVLVSTVRPNLMSHLLFPFGGDNWVCSTGFCVVRCRKGVSHPGYVYFHMFADCVARQIEALLTGSNYPAINSGDVRALQFPFPQYKEQVAIADVLSDMDAEITALEAKLAKARQIKQGMMQELLTGRIRLV